MRTKKEKAAAKKPYDNSPIFLTAEGVKKLKEKYERVKKSLPRLIAETARTAAYGDRSDNAEYKQAKGALRFTNYEIERVEDQLKRVVEIKPDKKSAGKVQLGGTVVIESETGAETKYHIVGQMETDPEKGLISNDSPLGAALLHRKIGDEVVVKTTHGSQTYRIKKIA